MWSLQYNTIHVPFRIIYSIYTAGVSPLCYKKSYDVSEIYCLVEFSRLKATTTTTTYIKGWRVGREGFPYGNVVTYKRARLLCDCAFLFQRHYKVLSQNKIKKQMKFTVIYFPFCSLDMFRESMILCFFYLKIFSCTRLRSRKWVEEWVGHTDTEFIVDDGLTMFIQLLKIHSGIIEKIRVEYVKYAIVYWETDIAYSMKRVHKFLYL